MERINWVVICVAMMCLAAIEIVALLNGINGTLLMLVIAAVAGLAGWTIPTPKLK